MQQSVQNDCIMRSAPGLERDGLVGLAFVGLLFMPSDTWNLQAEKSGIAEVASQIER